MTKKIRLPDLVPRDYQIPFFEAMDSGIKRAVLVMHRRAGKEIICWNYMIREACCSRVGTYCYFFPTSRLGKRILWDGSNKDGKRFIDYIPKQLIKSENSVEMKIELVNGSVIQIMGTDQIINVGINPIGCVFSEFSLQDPKSWTYVRPILRENEGWAVFNFCVAKDTLIFTENGIRRIDSVCDPVSEFTDVDLNVFGLGGMHKAEQFYSGGKKKLLKIRTKKGYTLSCTPNHPIWDGEAWKRADEWKEGDILPVQIDQQCWGEGVDLSSWERPVAKDGRGRQKLLPEFPLDEDMYYLMGLYLAEGCIQLPKAARGGKITITNTDDQIISFLEKNGFKTQEDGIHHTLCSTQLVSLFIWFGLSGTAKTKRIPEKLFEAKREEVVQFLKGYFDGDGTTKSNDTGYIKVCSVSEELLRNLQVLLANFGIVSRLYDSHTPPTKRVKVWSHLWNLEIEGHFAHRYFERIGFGLDRKQERGALISQKRKDGRGDIVPIDPSKVGYLLTKGKVTNPNRISYRKIESLNSEKESPYFSKILSDGFHYDYVNSIESEEDDVYDFVIPETHSFTTNGIISHNTPRGRNHAYDLYTMAKDNPEWFCQSLTIEDTGVLTKEDMDKERAEGMSETLIQQEYYVTFDQGIEGAYYSKHLAKAEAEGRITNVPYDPYMPVDTYWDLGVSDSTAIVFAQNIGQEIHIIDTYSNEGEGLNHYAKVLADKARDNVWLYGDHYAPHDIQVRELGSGAKSRLQMAKDMGINFRVVPNISILEGIEQVRSLFHKFWIDANKCKHLIKCIEHYHRSYNERLNVFSDKPVHDWSSHFNDCVRYLCVAQSRKRRASMTEDQANNLERLYVNKY